MSFASDMARWAEQSNRTLDSVTRQIRLQAVELVTEKMPVDTGQARGSLIASIGSPADSPDIKDATTSGAITRAQGAVNSPTNNVFYYTSNLPYIAVIERGGFGTGSGATNKTTRDGYSIQAPSGVFAISAVQLHEGTRDIINANN